MKPMHSLAAQRGTMLVEGLVAILIFSLGILAIVGLQAAAVRQTTDAKYRADASLAANQSIGAMWAADHTQLSQFAVANEVVADLPKGKRTIEVVGQTIKVTVTWQAPGEKVAHSYTTITQING